MGQAFYPKRAVFPFYTFIVTQSLAMIAGDIFNEKKYSIVFFPLSLKEGNWHNSKISSRILLRTLVFTGRNYHLLFKRISEKINSDLIWQGNYFSGLITLQEI